MLIIINGSRRLLVTEVKGQWHDELYSVASAQLHERYSIHPDAEQQGVYLVIWFGSEEKVAGRKKHGITSAQELKVSIEEKVPPELINFFTHSISLSTCASCSDVSCTGNGCTMMLFVSPFTSDSGATRCQISSVMNGINGCSKRSVCSWETANKSYNLGPDRDFVLPDQFSNTKSPISALIRAIP